ncbi:MAG: type IX secretion system membrane protein PorP/SprF [candidate division WOR-3 bacterium]
MEFCWLTQLEKIGLLFSYSKPYLGLASVNVNKNFFSLVVPTDIIPLGISLYSLSAGETIKYNENNFIFSCALDKKIKYTKFSLGFGLKLLWNSYDIGVDDPIIKDKKSNFALGLNIGLLITTEKFFNKKISIGLSSDLNEPNIGLSQEDLVKRKMLLGISLRSNIIKDVESIFATSFLFYKNNFLWLIGSEFTIRKHFSFRCGYNYSDFNLGFGYKIGTKFLKNMCIDYSYSIPLTISGSNGSHSFSLNISFDKKLNFKRK